MSTNNKKSNRFKNELTDSEYDENFENEHYHNYIKNQRNIDNPTRLTERHFPSLYTSKGKNRSRRCVVCSTNNRRSESRYECKDCNVGLCIDPCFRLYHTQLDYKY